MTSISPRFKLANIALAWVLGTLSTSAVMASTASAQFKVTGAVVHTTVHDATSLTLLTPTIQEVAYGSGAGPQSHTYIGTSLWGVLDGAGLVTKPQVKNDILNRYVLATGSDGYKVVFSLGELNPAFGRRPDLLAYAEQQAGGSWAPLGADGFARVTAPGDVKGGRYVSNLVNLDVRASGSSQVGTGGGVSAQFTVSGQVKQSTTFDLEALQASLPTVHQVVGAHTYTG